MQLGMQLESEIVPNAFKAPIWATGSALAYPARRLDNPVFH